MGYYSYEMSKALRPKPKPMILKNGSDDNIGKKKKNYRGQLSGHHLRCTIISLIAQTWKLKLIIGINGDEVVGGVDSEPKEELVCGSAHESRINSSPQIRLVLSLGFFFVCSYCGDDDLIKLFHRIEIWRSVWSQGGYGYQRSA